MLSNVFIILPSFWVLVYPSWQKPWPNHRIRRLEVCSNDLWYPKNIFSEWATIIESSLNFIIWIYWYYTMKIGTYGNSNNVEGLGTSIVGAVHDGGDWESHWNVEFTTRGTTSTALRHFLPILNYSKIKISDSEVTIIPNKFSKTFLKYQCRFGLISGRMRWGFGVPNHDQVRIPNLTFLQISIDFEPFWLSLYFTPFHW